MIFFVHFPQIHGSITVVMRMITTLLMMTIITCNCQESRSCSDLWRRETTTRRKSSEIPGGWLIEDDGQGDDDDDQGDGHGDGYVESSMRQRQGGNHPAVTSGGLRIELRMLAFLPGKHFPYIGKKNEDFLLKWSSDLSSFYAALNSDDQSFAGKSSNPKTLS